MPSHSSTSERSSASEMSTVSSVSVPVTPHRVYRKPLHIVHIIKHCGYGNGNVHVAIDLACVQARQGHRVAFVSAGGTFVPLLEEYGVHHVTMVQEQRQIFGMLRTAWRLTRFVRQRRPDVLHAHMMSSAILGYIASRLSRTPLVTTVHNSFDKHSRLMRLGDRVVAVSHAERDSLCRNGYAEESVDVVRNAPDRSPREQFMNDQQKIVLRQPCILAANGLHPRKGVSDLIQACALVLPQCPDWHVYIAGEGPHSEQLKAEVEQHGLTDRVTFLGFVRSPRPLMVQAEIFVLASYADPCSLAIGEARVAGCAIVATAVGGTPEMLENGKAGYLINPKSPVQMAENLIGLMLNDVARHNLQSAAKAGSEAFDVEHMVSGYDRVYRGLQRG